MAKPPSIKNTIPLFIGNAVLLWPDVVPEVPVVVPVLPDDELELDEPSPKPNQPRMSPKKPSELTPVELLVLCAFAGAEKNIVDAITMIRAK